MGAHPYVQATREEHWDELCRLYEQSGFAPLWVDEGGPTVQAKAIVAVLGAAEGRGLLPADYAAHELADDLACFEDQGASGPELEQFDTALTLAVLNYSRDAYRGRIDPQDAGFERMQGPETIDLVEFVAGLAQAEDPVDRLATLDPPLAIFVHLRAALARMRTLAQRNDLPLLGEVPKLRPGDPTEHAPALRSLLRAWGDLPDGAPVPTNGVSYDDALVGAVKSFQERHGLDADGVIGPATLRQMQVPPDARVRQIEIAMERLRWLPRGFAERFVLVNIPEFQLHAFEGGDRPMTMKVVVGKAARKTQTPIVHADMAYVAFRPYWEVPPKIAREEILPKVAQDPSYLERHRMTFRGERIRQLPGPDNSLGLVKFIFPNPHHVYLHDTPQRALFRRARRDFSHGCIRVAEPARLAQWVLSGQDGWDEGHIKSAMLHGKDNRRVYLERPVPVYVLYSTVVVGRDGRIGFHEDIYGHDSKLLELLEKRRPHS
jgi:murein L,D-transpeptidase YcbB/YkuD